MLLRNACQAAAYLLRFSYLNGGDLVSTGLLKPGLRAEEVWLASLIIRTKHTNANDNLALAA
jgi:hypothetical protein